MAKIIPIDIIKGMTGKVCQHSDTYFSINSVTGVTHTGKICNPYTGEPTQKQLAQQEAFRKKAELVNAWLLAHKDDELRRQAESLRKSLQLASVRSVVYRFIGEDGVVKFPDGSTSSAPVNPNPNPGNTGGDDEDGGF